VPQRGHVQRGQRDVDGVVGLGQPLFKSTDVTQVPVDKLHARAHEPPGVLPADQCRHFHAACAQLFDDVVPEEPRASGDECFHCDLSFPDRPVS